ncbi:MAG: carboxylate-amine ligase [Actinobacteria bacterium]|nr:carboxylate-amine ligase [Actinomycetota bacterium]
MEKVEEKINLSKDDFKENFGSTKEFTIGIEEEFQIIDPESYELTPGYKLLHQSATDWFKKKLQSELFASEIETVTPVCETIKEAREQVISNRKALKKLADENNFKIAAAGTHPFSKWRTQSVTDSEYYQRLLDNLQWVIRQNVVFGQHVHIGIGDANKAILIMNALRTYLPHFLALSVNSPFWEGFSTGLKSTRAQIFTRSFLRKGIPPVFNNWDEYIEFEMNLVKTNCIKTRGEIWWDIRPHRVYGTLEVRVCDVQIKVDDCIALAALIQATIVRLSQLYEEGADLWAHPASLLDENKWRAIRYGLDGKVIDIEKKEEITTVKAIEDLLNFIENTVKELSLEEEIKGISRIIDKKTGAERQLEEYHKAGDFKELMEYLSRETFIY